MAKVGALIAVLAGSFLFIADTADAQQRDRTQSTATARPLTLAERQAAWSSNKAEYQRRVVRDGQSSADRWLDERARASTNQPRPKASTRTKKKNCKKVRWVNRATPGFGGAPMTMRRVAVCAD